MYKFSRCHVVVFYSFSFYLPIFDKNRLVSTKIHPKIATGKIADSSVKSAD
jgi:hypothetical protein